MTSVDSRWTTAHLGVDGALNGALADRLLLELVAPLVDELQRRGHIDRFFFLRYNVPDHHLRLRLGTLRDDAQRQAIREITEGVVEAHGEVPYLQWHPYEPEVERYGGLHGLAVSEDLFMDASRSALALQRKIPPGDGGSRLGKGLLSSLVLLYVYTGRRADASHLAHAYVRGYLHLRRPDQADQADATQAFDRGFDRQAQQLAGFVEAAWQGLADGDSLTPELDAYRVDMQRHRDTLRRLAAEGRLETEGRIHDDWPVHVLHLMPSYLHMMNNRLGVGPEEEAYLAQIIHRTLSGGGTPEGGAREAPSSDASGPPQTSPGVSEGHTHTPHAEPRKETP